MLLDALTLEPLELAVQIVRQMAAREPMVEHELSTAHALKTRGAARRFNYRRETASRSRFRFANRPLSRGSSEAWVAGEPKT